ncbi:hypothetical protein R3W88_033453 [Solanum pinnatisectum]|uniref:Pectinesterase catalytic domain-containing protein n=1 Tax=Solanum pinnatisectum TaxID=50273 RepID=A0AAV9K0Y0_9SOLN|nr:hypothetical protein R3W88_033453 [Solanum pinnatisectum]
MNLFTLVAQFIFNAVVVGNGFIAQDLQFQNTAGQQKHQAVALRVGEDQSVINRCKIDAFQDTLYTHTLRQFYRDCYITGTVDFIINVCKLNPHVNYLIFILCYLNFEKLSLWLIHQFEITGLVD